MNSLENINLSWNEITERSLKGVWKNVWPDLSKSEDIGHCRYGRNTGRNCGISKTNRFR